MQLAHLSDTSQAMRNVIKKGRDQKAMDMGSYTPLGVKKIKLMMRESKKIKKTEKLEKTEKRAQIDDYWRRSASRLIEMLMKHFMKKA
jgi:hypothetical protein